MRHGVCELQVFENVRGVSVIAFKVNGNVDQKSVSLLFYMGDFLCGLICNLYNRLVSGCMKQMFVGQTPPLTILSQPIDLPIP